MKEGYADNHFASLYYKELGQGVPLVMLHGNGESHQIFGRLSELMSRHYRVILMDSRGHGASKLRDTVRAQELTTSSMADDVVQVMDVLHVPKAVILGFSDGANVALEAASRYPDKALPKVFSAMGKAGTFVGILFFVTAIFATLSSCISVLESITANCMEIFHTSRKKTVLVLSVIYLAASAVIALGYSIFYVEVKLPNGSVGQLLDIMDYISNSVMMPFIALLSTILIGWVVTPDYVISEMERSGDKFRRKKLYRVMIRFVAPVMMFILFLQSTGILS